MPSAARIIIALDVASEGEALQLVERLAGHADLFKVGLRLFTAAGPQIVERLCRGGSGIFLDLKFHDIPNTVAGAVAEGCRTGAAILNVHASGGREMMAAAAGAADRFARETGLPRPLVAAVTVLTSLDGPALRDLGLDEDPAAQVVRLARLARESGLGGVVASPQEIALVKAAGGEAFQVIAPGIRPSWAGRDDQKRLATPAEAARRGADYLVIGRPITAAADPLAALQRVREEIASA